MIYVAIMEMHEDDVPFHKEVFTFDNIVEANFFASDLTLKILDNQWIDILDEANG